MKHYVERAVALRSPGQPPCNCCQAVLLSFQEEMGLDVAELMALGSNFGAGMGCGGTCGVVSGAVMAMGAMELSKGKSTGFLREFQAKHGALDCKTLLQVGRERGEDQSVHCNNLIFAGVEDLAELWSAQKDEG